MSNLDRRIARLEQALGRTDIRVRSSRASSMGRRTLTLFFRYVLLEGRLRERSQEAQLENAIRDLGVSRWG